MGNINYNDKFDIGIVSPSYKIFSIADGYNKRFIAAMLKTQDLSTNCICRFRVLTLPSKACRALVSLNVIVLAMGKKFYFGLHKVNNKNLSLLQ